MNTVRAFYSQITDNHQVLRIMLVILFFLSGNMKWFSPEMMRVDELTQATWLSFLPGSLGVTGTSYLFAVVQAAIMTALLAGTLFPSAGIAGALAAIISSAITLSVLPAALNTMHSGYYIKEIILILAGTILLYRDAITALKKRKKITWHTVKHETTFPEYKL